MPLWGSKDNASNSDIAAVMQVNKAMTTANQSLLFGNTTPNAFFSKAVVGQFGVDTKEVTAEPKGHGYHAGWVLRKEGTGLRAGRVTYETLVAMGSMTLDASDDASFPDFRIVITTQPVANTQSTNKAAAFTVVATSYPSTTLGYMWQVDGGPGVRAWSNIANSGVYQSAFSNNSATLAISNNALLTGNVYRVVIRVTGANTVYSSNATLTVS